MLKSAIEQLATSALTSRRLRAAQRGARALVRRISGARPSVDYFHQVDDPYSHIAVQLLTQLQTRYGIRITPHLVSPPSESAAPEGERLAAYAIKDAHRLAAAHNLQFPMNARRPSAAAIASVTATLATIPDAEPFAARAIELGEALWRGTPLPTASARNDSATSRGDALREKLGHYLGATFNYEGEWYWGIDRLPYLEERLRALKPSAKPLVRPLVEGHLPGADTRRAAFDMFLSFRSPYTYLAIARARKLAERFNADFRLRFVLPMVMRGLPVPKEKRLYIVRDAKREAQLHGLPFGRIVDPVGAGVERGLALLHYAVARGRGCELAESFLKGAFADGLDAASDEGLNTIAGRAGLTSKDITEALADSSWRAVAENNRTELFALGLWGVPSFRVAGMDAHWGQDRLWAVEEDLACVARALAQTKGSAL